MWLVKTVTINCYRDGISLNSIVRNNILCKTDVWVSWRPAATLCLCLVCFIIETVLTVTWQMAKLTDVETGNPRSLSPLPVYVSVGVLLFRHAMTLNFVRRCVTDGMLNSNRSKISYFTYWLRWIIGLLGVTNKLSLFQRGVKANVWTCRDVTHSQHSRQMEGGCQVYAGLPLSLYKGKAPPPPCPDWVESWVSQGTDLVTQVLSVPVGTV
jgi:hypothetical protein